MKYERDRTLLYYSIQPSLNQLNPIQSNRIESKNVSPMFKTTTTTVLVGFVVAANDQEDILEVNISV